MDVFTLARMRGFGCIAEAREAADDLPVARPCGPTLGEVIGHRFGRRDVLRGALGVSAAAVFGPAAFDAPKPAHAAAQDRFVWEEIAHGVDETHHVAPGYFAEVLIRWGDPVLPGAPAFDPLNQTADAQERQFGYNNDYIGLVPLPWNAAWADRALMCVNHEYTNEEVMFPGLGRQERAGFANMTKALVEVEMAAHGGSILEVRREGDGPWRVVTDSPFARRITARSTRIDLAGPVAGHDRVKTADDPGGTRVIGTLNNCAGGITPWGTYLMAEENFRFYFSGTVDPDHPEAANHDRYGFPVHAYAWGRYFDRFDLSKEPREPNRFGWVVEVDPFDPYSVPKKRTALGRFNHEGAETIINGDGRIVSYMGDDARFEYVYRFVSSRPFLPEDRNANFGLLDDGVLSVARFHADGTLDWLPLIFGTGPLTPANGFQSQADVLIETRRAADLLGATQMDRPEDVQPNPATGKVYVMLTNNSRREADQTDAANPRGPNGFGHIVEITATGGDHGADRATWDLLVVCGDPRVAEVGAVWNPATSADGWFASPDNAAVDHQGRLWITTDQGRNWPNSGTADGVWGLETEGPMRGRGKMFFRVPVGAEMCGPVFTPDDETLFVAVQHPGTDGTRDFPGFARESTFEDPATRWPDFQDGMPPRPSVLAITKQGGGKIGT